MSESAWRIPSDWDGESRVCIRIQWPDSPEWQRLLISLLYTLTRGREWDKNTGNIRDTQVVAWSIFDDNVPLRLCAEQDGGEVLPPPLTIEYRGGSLIVMGENEMGQVVTDVYIDSSTGELVVEFGPCCKFRYLVVARVRVIYIGGYNTCLRAD